MNFKELETKYSADDVKFEDFVDLCSKFSVCREMMVSSYDDYFVDNSDNFIRYRHRDGFGELTIKRKTSDKNNNNRIEVNLPTTGNNLKSVAVFADLLGYSCSFGIWKTAKIYWIDRVVVAYYIVYDRNLKELRRFIEIEANEELNWDSESQAWDEITKWEKIIEPLGITPKNRLKKSLFEMFKK
jgi:adenylate cyclase class IV